MDKIISFFEDTRNVIDEFKGVPTESIKEKLTERSLPFAVAMEHFSGDFNLGTVLRNANAFGAREVFYVGGRKKWDKRAACGVAHYTSFSHLIEINELIPLKEKYRFIGVDNIPGSVPLEGFDWGNEPVLMIFGEEGSGLTYGVIELCDAVVAITQRGSVRSLNAGCASAIAMYDYSCKARK
jgi:tRNA G18 (ribose-2'-O)-methylase SpoU